MDARRATRILWPRIPVSRNQRPSVAETGSTWMSDQGLRPSARCCRDHSVGKSQSRVAPTPRGRRPSRAALTRTGDKNASEIVMFIFRWLQLSRSAMLAAVAPGVVTNSSNHRRPRALATINVARVSERMGRASAGVWEAGIRISRRRFDGCFCQGRRMISTF